MEETLYPPPYKVIDDCLYIERTGAQGTYDRKLCNFAPRLLCEITVDDGLRETKLLRLGGTHSNGYDLREIEIAGSELGGFNWLIERWGAECSLETGANIKDSVRHAIQSTAPYAERKNVYTVTGWKKIGGRWEFLMPGNDSLTVSLPGKLKRYGMKKGYELRDIAAAYALLENPAAPKEVIYPLTAFTFLSPLIEFLHLANCQPKFVLFLTGKTGTRKSTLAALFLSFFGNFTSSDLPLSFRDTANSIIHHAFALKDVLTCIDDLHPCGRQEEHKMSATAQAIVRAYGDRSGRGRLRSNASPMEARPPQGNAIVTAEFAPDIGESGTARCFTLELKDGDVDLKRLSLFQAEAETGGYQGCMLAFVEWIRERFLSAEQKFIEWLRKIFVNYREEFLKSGIRCHGRVGEIYSWLKIGMKMFLIFLKEKNMLTDEREKEIDREFSVILFQLAANQSENIEQDKPAVKFIRKLYSLLDSGQASVLNRNSEHECLPNNFIGYEDDDYFYLINDAAHRAVKRLCDEQGELFSVSQRGLLKALAEEKLIETSDGQNTKTVRFGSTTKRVVCLKKSKARLIADSE